MAPPSYVRPPKFDSEPAPAFDSEGSDDESVLERALNNETISRSDAIGKRKVSICYPLSKTCSYGICCLFVLLMPWSGYSEAQQEFNSYNVSLQRGLERVLVALLLVARLTRALSENSREHLPDLAEESPPAYSSSEDEGDGDGC